MASECPAHCAMDWIPAGGRSTDRPEKIWQATFREDIQARGVSWSELEAIAADSECWRNPLLNVLQWTKGTEVLSKFIPGQHRLSR